MDLSSVILDFASDYTVTRYTGVGSYSDGVHVPPASSTLTVKAVVQPMSGRELERLPEGLRAGEVQVVYSLERLRAKAPNETPDQISIGGASWQVETSEDWQVLGNYYRSVVRKVT